MEQGLLPVLLSHRFSNISFFLQRQSYGPSEQGTRSVDNDWLAGTSADPSLRQRKKKTPSVN